MSPDAPPHPRLGCRCSEGRVVSGGRGDVRFLPGVHSCAYVRVREAQIPEAERRASLDVERSSPGWTSRFMHHMSALTAAALLDARAREDRASL